MSPEDFNHFFRNDGLLRGGGRDQNIIAFYFQGFIARNKSNHHEWQLLTSTADPFDDSQRNDRIELSELFRHIAEATPLDSLAIVALDVTPPNVITNLGDLEFPSNDIHEAFKRIGDLGDRLMVILPCGQGQQNWGAPELSSSAFGHYFLEGIESGFRKGNITADGFRTELTKRVRSWVAQGRKSIQEPQFLTIATDQKLGQFKFYRFLTQLPAATRPTTATGQADRFKKLDVSWDEFSGLAAFAAWNPILYAKLESQLIAMESVVETEGSSWDQRVIAFQIDLDKAKSQWKCDRRVSLIESEFNQRLGRCEIFDWDLLSNERRTTTSLSQPIKKTQSVGRQDRDNLALEIWRRIEAVATSNDAARWNTEFSRETLRDTFQALDATKSETEWLEIQLCKTLFNDVNWKSASDETTKAFANLIRCFSKLQRIHCTSLPNESSLVGSLLTLPYERAAWCEKEALELDKQFHRAFDAFCANEWSRSLEVSTALLQPTGRIDAFQSRANTIDQHILARDRVIQEVPHLLGLLMRIGQHMEIKTGNELSKQSAILLNRAKDIESKLSDPDETPFKDSQALSLMEQLKLLRTDVLKLIQEQVDPSKATDPESIYAQRIALRFPHLENADRKRFHNNLAAFYARRIDYATESDEKLSSQPFTAKGIQDGFVAGLEQSSNKDRDVYVAIATSDLRSDPNWLTDTKGQGRTPAENEHGLRVSKYHAGSRIKAYANALAYEKLSDSEEPWSSPLEFQAICEQNFRELQSMRLYEARWGDGFYSDNQERLYIRRLANQYLDPPAHCKAWISVKLSNRVYNAWERAKHDLSSIRTSDAQDEPNRKLEIEWMAAPADNSWGDAVASIRQKSSTSDNDFAPVVSPLAFREKAISRIGFDYRVDDLAYRLSIRGNLFDKQVKRSAERERVAWTFSPPNDLASVKVNANAEPQSVVILLDCSKSMTHEEVSMPRGAFAEAIKTVDNLLKNLKDRSDQGIHSEVSIMAFGLKFDDEMELPPGFKFARAGGKKLASVDRNHDTKD
ncbi:MAG: hypothetical protein ABL921_30225, partial [Pirellula sp.]